MYVENANRASKTGSITVDNLEPNSKNPLIAAFFRNIGYFYSNTLSFKRIAHIEEKICLKKAHAGVSAEITQLTGQQESDNYAEHYDKGKMLHEYEQADKRSSN